MNNINIIRTKSELYSFIHTTLDFSVQNLSNFNIVLKHSHYKAMF